jgi:hypothetical protein
MEVKDVSHHEEDLSRSLVLSSKKQLSDDLSEVSSLSEGDRDDGMYTQVGSTSRSWFLLLHGCNCRFQRDI